MPINVYAPARLLSRKDQAPEEFMRACPHRARGAALRECHPERDALSASMSRPTSPCTPLSQREFQILCKLAWDAAYRR